jgi:hypothetical protein
MSATVQNLLLRAESAGIRLRLDGNKLKATLPDPDDPDVLEVVDQLRRHRDEVRHLLDSRGGPTHQEENAPIVPCYTCGSRVYWRRPTGGYVCAECHPDPWVPASERIQ